jgi:hypothetical protein
MKMSVMAVGVQVVRRANIKNKTATLGFLSGYLAREQVKSQTGMVKQSSRTQQG